MFHQLGAKVKLDKKLSIRRREYGLQINIQRSLKFFITSKKNYLMLSTIECAVNNSMQKFYIAHTTPESDKKYPRILHVHFFVSNTWVV